MTAGRFTTRDAVLAVIQQDQRPPTWRWQATAHYAALLPALWEWQADASRESILLARELMHIEEEARWRWPTSTAASAADCGWWKRQP